MIRYRFNDFTLSPQRRRLVRDGREVPLIPRYFDLLVLLVERRHEAVHRKDIFERVWADVIVSDSALSQAIRTIRVALGDDSREPRFIRTVSRHGYQFVLPNVIEEEDDGAAAPTEVSDVPPVAAPTPPEPGWLDGSLGGAVAGVAAGGLGGLILAVAPGSVATFGIAPVLAVLGAGCGAVGGAGVGAGVSYAELAGRTPRALWLAAGGALGGGLAGGSAQWLARWALAVLMGLDLSIGGALEGVVIGAAAGVGYAFATSGSDTFSRGRAMLILALLCGMAGLALALLGHPLVGGTIHMIADAVQGSRATLAPLGRLIGEPDFGPVSRAIIAFGEGATFGLGLAWGLTRRPSHRNLT